MADYTDVRESLVAAMETQSQLVSLMGEVRGHVRTGHDAVDTILAIRTNNFIHEPQQASVPELARTALTEADMAFQKGNNAKVPATTSQQRVDGALGTSSNSAAREACAMAATQVETLGQVALYADTAMKRLDQAMGNAPDAVLEEVGGAFAQCDDATTQSIQNAIHLHNAVNSYLRAQGVVELDPPSWT